MTLEILCTPRFSKKEENEIEQAARRLHMTHKEFIRAAVRNYSDMCVPTHSREMLKV